MMFSQELMRMFVIQYLFTTNTGDSTLSMFRIDPKDPMHPKVVGTPAPTLGDTPVSVAYSDAIKTGQWSHPFISMSILTKLSACVLNSGAKAGAACFSVDPQHGLIPLGVLRSVPQIVVDPNNPAKPAPRPLTIAADIASNPSSTALFFTTGAVNAKAGHIYAYPVDKHQVSMEPVISSFSICPPSSVSPSSIIATATFSPRIPSLMCLALHSLKCIPISE